MWDLGPGIYILIDSPCDPYAHQSLRTADINILKLFSALTTPRSNALIMCVFILVCKLTKFIYSIISTCFHFFLFSFLSFLILQVGLPVL